MDASRPAETQVEKSEEAVKAVPETDGKKSRDNTLQEHTEHFFVTQVCVHFHIICLGKKCSSLTFQFINTFKNACLAVSASLTIFSSC